MKKRTKELTIIIPLIAISIFFVVSFYIPVETESVELLPTETSCQHGWFKYELESGTLCSKNPLSDEQIEEYQG